MLAGLAAEGHVADPGVRPDRKQRLAAVGAAVPETVMDGLDHFGFLPALVLLLQSSPSAFPHSLQ